MDGLEKDIAQVNALTGSSAELLREHQLEVLRHNSPGGAGDEHEKTLAGLAIGSTWDFFAGKAQTSQARVERAQQADQYAEITADTIASIPKFSALAGGIAHSVMLLDVSGQQSAASVARGFALNFVQGAAFNSVSRMATTEGVLGRMVSGRLGVGLTAEVATHALSGGGFGFVKSGLSESSWMDKNGTFSVSAGLKNIGASTTVGSLIGVPAGMAGMRVGKAVTLVMGSQAESSALATTIQKFATGGGSGFASGSVFGGVDAARTGKSMPEILNSSLQGGLIGFVTGGLSTGFDHSPVGLPSGFERSPGGASEYREQIIKAAALEAGGAARPRDEIHSRDLGGLSPTESLFERANTLLSAAGMQKAYDRLVYKPNTSYKLADFSGRIKPPVKEEIYLPTTKPGAPKNQAEYKEALKVINPSGGPLDFSKHYFNRYVDVTKQSVRIYEVQGHTAKIVVPEAYAQQLDAVSALRRAAEYPDSFNKLTQEQKEIALAAMKSGDANPLKAFMNKDDLAKFITAHHAKTALSKHDFGYRATVEDVVAALDGVPNRSLIKEVQLLDTNNVGDVYKSVVYDSPGFQSAATVTQDGVVNLYQQNHGAALHNTINHEWSHLAKWASPTYSKMFDLASMVDLVGEHLDHPATAVARRAQPDHEPIYATGLYYPDLHSTRNQDENFAVGLGEDMAAPDPTSLFSYVVRAPVRTMTLSAALERNVLMSSGSKAGTLASNMADRAEFAAAAARPYAISALEEKMQSGTPAQRAAAANLMGFLGTSDQAHELLDMATDKANKVVPDWQGTAGEEAMAGDDRTVAQHAFSSYLNVRQGGEGRAADAARFNLAVQTMVTRPELREVAGDYALRSEDARLKDYAPLIKLYDPQGDPLQRAASVELVRAFGGAQKAEILLSMALDKGNERVPKFRESTIPPQFARRLQTVSQTAYNAYVDASAHTIDNRADFAFNQGLERRPQRDLASTYLVRSHDLRSRGLGQFLAMYDLPGHVSKMQELIGDNFRHSPADQKMVFDHMLDLTATDPRRQIEILSRNLHEPNLLTSSVTRLDTLLGRGVDSVQRQQIRAAVNERMRWPNYSDDQEKQLNGLLDHLGQEDRLQEALGRMQWSPDRIVDAMHDLADIHDQRAIKPLLQQAISGNQVVEREAVEALQRFNPALVKFYGQELKREYMVNPEKSFKLADLLSSKRLLINPLSTPPSTPPGQIPLQ